MRIVIIAAYLLAYHRLRSGGESTTLSQYPGASVTSIRSRVNEVDNMERPSDDSPARIYMGPFEAGITEKSVRSSITPFHRHE
jgi:hypothetical protein